MESSFLLHKKLVLFGSFHTREKKYIHNPDDPVPPVPPFRHAGPEEPKEYSSYTLSNILYLPSCIGYTFPQIGH